MQRLSFTPHHPLGGSVVQTPTIHYSIDGCTYRQLPSSIIAIITDHVFGRSRRGWPRVRIISSHRQTFINISFELDRRTDSSSDVSHLPADAMRHCFVVSEYEPSSSSPHHCCARLSVAGSTRRGLSNVIAAFIQFPFRKSFGCCYQGTVAVEQSIRR